MWPFSVELHLFQHGRPRGCRFATVRDVGWRRRVRRLGQMSDVNWARYSKRYRTAIRTHALLTPPDRRERRRRFQVELLRRGDLLTSNFRF